MSPYRVPARDTTFRWAQSGLYYAGSDRMTASSNNGATVVVEGSTDYMDYNEARPRMMMRPPSRLCNRLSKPATAACSEPLTPANPTGCWRYSSPARPESTIKHRKRVYYMIYVIGDTNYKSWQQEAISC